MSKLSNLLIGLFLFVAFLGATRSLYGPGYFNMHDDLQVMRLNQMERCFADGQIPCRWSPDMAWGYGQPMFNYYSALPYYLGYLIRVFTPLSLMSTVLLLFNISIIASGVGMYLLARRFWGRLAGITAAVLYVYAPYHLLDVYIRGAMSESYALAILPFLWLSIYDYIKNPNFGNFTFVSVSSGLLLITHNLSTFMYAPFTALWAGYWLLERKNLKVLAGLTLSGIFGLGLGAFFFLPVMFERNLIQTEFLTMDYLNYEAHFVTLKQLFIQRNWGHGPSIFGPYDEISFQIGWPHWFLLIPLFVLLFNTVRKNNFNKRLFLIVAFVLLFFGTAFLTHPKSIFIWKQIPQMSIIQFPWRFLGLSMFFLSFAVSGLFHFRFWFRKLIFSAVILLTIILNFNYAVPWNRSYHIGDEDKLTGIAWDLQRKSAILDYLPKTARIAPKEEAFKSAEVATGEADVENFKLTSSTFSFDLTVYSKQAEITVPVMYFPNWIVVSGGKTLDHKVTGDYGLITISMPEGRHIIQGRFLDTPIRSVANIISLITMAIIFSGYLYFTNKNNEA